MSVIDQPGVRQSPNGPHLVIHVRKHHSTKMQPGQKFATRAV